MAVGGLFNDRCAGDQRPVDVGIAPSLSFPRRFPKPGCRGTCILRPTVTVSFTSTVTGWPLLAGGPAARLFSAGVLAQFWSGQDQRAGTQPLPPGQRALVCPRSISRRIPIPRKSGEFLKKVCSSGITTANGPETPFTGGARPRATARPCEVSSLQV